MGAMESEGEREREKRGRREELTGQPMRAFIGRGEVRRRVWAVASFVELWTAVR